MLGPVFTRCSYILKEFSALWSPHKISTKNVDRYFQCNVKANTVYLKEECKSCGI